MKWSDRLNQFSGKTRFVGCRIFVHLNGNEVAPLLGTLNQAAYKTIEADGDFEAMGEGLVDICQHLIQMQNYWQSAANEGDVFWDEGEAGDYVTALFTDSAQRYLSDAIAADFDPDEDSPLTLSLTRNLIVMIAIAYTGEAPALETNLADRHALVEGLKTVMNLHYQGQLEAMQVHFSPAQLGDILTEEQVLINFPELIPL
jgi:hypothetical protein